MLRLLDSILRIPLPISLSVLAEALLKSSLPALVFSLSSQGAHTSWQLRVTRALNRSCYILSPKLGSSPCGSGGYMGVPPYIRVQSLWVRGYMGVPPYLPGSETEWKLKTKWKQNENKQCIQTFLVFKTTLLQWLTWRKFLQRDHMGVHRSTGRTCRYAWSTWGTWGRDDLGCSRSEMWPVPGTCCSHTGNVPVECYGCTHCRYSGNSFSPHVT